MQLEDITIEHINVDAGPIESAMEQLAEGVRNQVWQQLDDEVQEVTDERLEQVETKVREMMVQVLGALGYID